MKKIIIIGICAIFYISCSYQEKEKRGNKVPKTIVSKGDKVSIYYKGSYPDGTVFDERWDHTSPLIFTTGTGVMIPGFDKAVIGMKVQEEKTVTIKPADAYGEYRKELLKKIDRKQLRKGFEPKVGDRIRYPKPDGKPSYSIYPIVEVKDEYIVLDLNRQMAGKTLIFTIKIDKIE